MNSKVLTLAGAVALVIGLFLPIISAMGISANMLMPPGEGVTAPGLILLACAVIAGILALLNQAKWAVIPGLAALAFLVWKFLQAKDALSTALGDVPPEAAELMAAMAPSLNYLGWGVMGVGALVIAVGGAMGWKKTTV